MFFKLIVLIGFAALVLVATSPILDDEPRREARIVGGVGVTLGQVPSMASLRSFNGNFHFCSGTILTTRWILTTGLCTAGRAGNSINVIVGSVTLNAGGITHRSFNITEHPSFDRNTLANDVSLIYTATVIVTTANIQTIAMSANIIGGGVSAQISGWGSSLQSGGLSPNNLQRLTTTTITNADCRSRHIMQNAMRIFDSKICTFTRSGEGTCHGDEGGALIAGGQIIGISSWQVPCAVGTPDIFERVSSFRFWALSVMG